ncbi:MAG TPA: glycerophosphodiester phosphodiesterase family protein [Planctomycetota bacterium]|nr:glycerophosphodiester phosphodiesterase family protein [Planctomycetota bacterium]
MNPFLRGVPLERPLRIGHRGAPKLAPENTLASFERAFASPSVDMVELDVHLTKDGKVAVIHDDKLDRTTKAKGFVSEREVGELRELGVPLLEDVLELARRREKGVMVELKMQPRFYRELPAAVLALVRAARMESSVIVTSFDHRSIAALKKAAPEIACGALCGQRLHEPGRYVAEFLGLDWWLPGCLGDFDSIGFFSAARDLDKEGLEGARRAGVKTCVWTVNVKEWLAPLLALGAEGIISDDLDVLALVGS